MSGSGCGDRFLPLLGAVPRPAAALHVRHCLGRLDQRDPPTGQRVDLLRRRLVINYILVAEVGVGRVGR